MDWLENKIWPIEAKMDAKDIYWITNEDAMEAARALAKEQGLLVGISSGAAYAAACRLMQQPDYKDKTIVVLLPDTGERYLSVL